MHAHAHTHRLVDAPAATPRPRLREAPAPTRRRRRPSAADLALYSLGLTAGFLLAALASAPGGGLIVAGQMALAVVGALVCALALLRARAVSRAGQATRIRATGL